MFNGYEHPGPAPQEFTLDAGESWAQRAEREAREEYEKLECKCAVCVLKGPGRCSGENEPIGIMTTEQARAARKALTGEGQRQAEQRRRREQLIDAQADKALAAGHEPRRVERGAEIVKRGQLDDAVAAYGATTAGCGCPDAKWRGHGGSAAYCKHRLAAIISANVERALKRSDDTPAAPEPQETGQVHVPDCPTCGYPTDEPICPVCAMVIDPLSDEVPAEVLDPAGILWS